MPAPTPPSLLPHLLSPLKLGALQLGHRIVMPALAQRRARAPGGVPTAQMAQWYGERSSPGGLVICEAASVTAGAAAPDAPGLHSTEQVNHWRLVVDAVHRRGGIVVAQLGHGCEHVRDVHAALREPGLDDIEALLHDYRNAAENAGDAGFDGVELQAAHGALPERFFAAAPGRADGYGGSSEGRTRLLREALQALVGVWGGARVGVCLSPRAGDDAAFHAPLLGELYRQRVAYLHVSEPAATRLSRRLRAYFPGPLVAAGGFDGPLAEGEIAAEHADAVAFGRAFLAEPDLVQCLQRRAAAAASR